MRTADYIDIYNATAHKCKLGVDESGLQLTDGAEFVALRTFHSLRLRRIWGAQLWPDVCRTEKRYLRDLWDSVTVYAASTLTVATERFYPGPNKYYQGLAGSTGQAPATYSGNSWTTNLAFWAESFRSYSADKYDGAKGYVRGDKVYYEVTDRYYQLYAATSTGNAPSDTTKWGVLTEFVGYIGKDQTGKTGWDEGFGVWDRDPKVHGNAVRYRTWMSNLGIHVIDDVTSGYLQYRTRCPRLTGAVLGTGSVAAGLQVYYASGNVRGNFYDVVTTTNAGDTPESQAAKFSVVQIPLDFERYLVHGGAADYLRPEEPVEAEREEAQAMDAMNELGMVWMGQMGAGRQVEVRTR